MENQNQIANIKKMSWIFWFSFLAAIFIYTYIVYTLSNVPSQDLSPVSSTMKNVFYVLSIISAIISLFVVDRVFKSKFDKQNQTTQIDKYEALKLYYTYFIIKLAFAESIVVFGLVLSFMGSEKMSIFLPFAIFSSLVLLFNRPKETNI
ncbi:MAG: hypothetical protein WC070_00995 [Candidatus Magasanikbacteria bacterium]